MKSKKGAQPLFSPRNKLSYNRHKENKPVPEDSRDLENRETTVQTTQEVHNEAKQHMEQAIEALKRDLATIRTGRPTPALVEQIRVSYHGMPTALVAMAAITVEGHELVIKPWEQATIPDIERGILEANLISCPPTTVR